MPREMKIGFADKPNLSELATNNPAKFKEVMGTFVWLAEEAVQNGWHELPELFGQGKVKLSFSDLVKGILHGALDLPDINPEMYDTFKEEVHPLSMIVPRKDDFTGGFRYLDWREWYRVEPPTNQEGVAALFRKLLRYYRFISVDTLADALNNNQIKNWVGLENPNLVANLPFVPALRYQKRLFGDLHVGNFFDDIGFFDCGNWVDGDSTECPACQHETVKHVGKYHVCLSCNAGFVEEAL